jgi:hypothetical protein
MAQPLAKNNNTDGVIMAHVLISSAESEDEVCWLQIQGNVRKQKEGSFKDLTDLGS